MTTNSFATPQQFFRSDKARLSGFLVRDEAFDWQFDINLPFERLSIFARRIANAQQVSRMPISAFAVIGLTGASEREINEGKPLDLMTVPLGVVGTDHVGYASYDLWVLRSTTTMDALRERLKDNVLLPGPPRPSLCIKRLLVLPFMDRNYVFDALNEGVVGPNFVSLQLELDDIMLEDRAVWPPMPAMQTPSILDWRLSPGSFSMVGALLIGEDGCETLLPSNLATRLVKFRQLVTTDSSTVVAVRDTHVVGNADNVPIFAPVPPEPCHLGYLVEYRSEWFPLGHSLGRIAYSLPLAPAEKVQLAVVDWARKDAASRTENTDLHEELNNDTLRDRTVTEAANMVVREAQAGNSFMGGLGLGAGAGIPIGPVSIGAGLSGGLGGAHSSTSGMRSLVGDTTQHITDAFHQAATSQRELNSTVVVQGEQGEKASAKTRSIVNYNHSHALTILYYEVLHHERILTRPASTTPVLMLTNAAPEFDFEAVEQNMQVISAALLDADLKDCLKMLDRRAVLEADFERQKALRAQQGDPAQDNVLQNFTLRISTGAVGAQGDVWVTLITKAGGARIACEPVDQNLWSSYPASPAVGMNDLSSKLRFAPNLEFIADFRPQGAVRWNNIESIEIKPIGLKGIVPGGPPPDWIINEARITTQTGPDKWVMFNGAPEIQEFNWGKAARLAVAPFAPPVTSVEDLLSAEEKLGIRRVMAHLNKNKGHYWRAIWLAEDPSDRALRFGKRTFGGKPLLGVIENRLLGVVDDALAFPIARGQVDFVRQVIGGKKLLDIFTSPTEDYVEQILSFPTRGVFAEAKLGHCNASELIDPSRFWDWQTSPIPDQAPTIAAVSTDSRFQAPEGTGSTPFPQSLVNIVNPTQAPDPSGLAAAGGVLGALGAFKDMSGMQQLGPYLQTLANNASQQAGQGLKNAQTGSLLNMIRSSDELTPKEKTDLIGQLLGGQVKAVAPPAQATPGAPPPSPSTAPATSPPSSGGQGVAPPPQSPQQPAPAPQPKVDSKKPPVVSDKNKELAFDFLFDTNQSMSGHWTVKLISGKDQATSFGMIDTSDAGSTSGAYKGNRIEMIIPSSFGADKNVSIYITGSIMELPKVFTTASGNYELDGWHQDRRSTKVISRADFDKTRSYQVIQKTSEVKFTAATTQTGTNASSTSITNSNGFEGGVEGSGGGGGPDVGGTGGGKFGTKNSFGFQTQELTSGQVVVGDSRQVEFSGRKVSDEAPSIIPV